MLECPLIILVDENENSVSVLKTYFKELNFQDKLQVFSNLDDAIEVIKEAENQPIVILDYDTSVEKFELVKLYTNKIIVATAEYSTDIIVKSMRMGVKEILPKPILKKDLKRAVECLLLPNEELTEEASKIISVYSNKGGIGKTTIATNLAYELSKVTREKVALIDMNLQLGDVSTFLNINPKFDLGYVIKNLLEKKDDVILQAFERYKNSDLYVLSDPNYIEESEGITPYKIDNFFKILRKTFSYIVIDMSSNVDSNSLKILDNSDVILFTTIINLPAIRNCQRCLDLFRSRRYSLDKVQVIINRYMENDDIKIEDIEDVLNKKIYWKLPNNYFSIMEAINKGVSVSEISLNSNITNSFRDLATKISDDFVQKTLIKYRGF